MNFVRPSPKQSSSYITPKFVDLYSKLFQGATPSQIAPGQDQERFFSDLLDLNVDRPHLEGELNKVPKDTCLGKLKVHISSTQRN